MIYHYSLPLFISLLLSAYLKYGMYHRAGAGSVTEEGRLQVAQLMAARTAEMQVDQSYIFGKKIYK